MIPADNFGSSGDTTFKDDESTLSFAQRSDHVGTLQAGTRLGPYDLKSLLGRGGFGEVWEAEDLRSGRRVAVKVLTQLRVASPEMLKRFKREGQLAASINHPRSVYVFGAEEIQGHPVISMELLSGGTLQDQLRLRGKLPAKDAVDLILEIIEGLEAAHTVGIVHRDVKPSNCFIDEEGRAKIGDFGISKTLEAQDGFTSAESFVGTPAFASPEQIRGRDVDFRSDIYSVGATLYAVLTGRPPFEGQNAGELLARILSEAPVPFTERQVQLPRGLDRIILRCLAKEREKRYRGYAELRADLLPFSSSYGLTAGNLAMRFAAFAIDEVVLTVGISTVIHALVSAWPGEVADKIFPFLYYGFFEAFWARSPGKYVMGLRVVAASGAPMSARQALVRTLVFGSIMLPATLVELRQGPAPLLGLATILVYLATMRRENGFAGPHEFLSGTRVIAVRKADTARTQVLQSDEWLTLRDDAHPKRFGPFRALRNLWETESEALILAFDELLKRNVWIHVTGSGRSQRLNRLIAVRPGRLRWLQSDRHGSVHWDAFEAPMGTSLYASVRSRGRITWSETRALLCGIVEELDARLDTGAAPVEVSLRHIWVDPQGRPKVLEFPAAVEGDCPGTSTVDARTGRTFVHQILRFALTGDVVPIESLGTAPPAVPLPEYARVFVTRICSSEDTFLPLSTVRSELHRLSDLPAEVGRLAKVGMLAAVAVLPVLLLLGNAFGPVINSIRTPEWQRELQRMPIYDTLMKRLDPYRNIPAQQAEIEAPCKVLAWVQQAALASPGGRVALSHLRSFHRERLETCTRRHPSIGESELVEARKVTNALIAEHFVITESSFAGRVEHGIDLIFWAGGFLWLLPVALSFAMPGGLMVRLFGCALQTTAGRPAGSLRCAVRSLLAWFPFVLFFPAVAGAGLLGYAPSAMTYWRSEGQLVSVLLLHGYASILWIITLALGSIVMIGMVYSVVKPARGLPDLIAGTCLVPK